MSESLISPNVNVKDLRLTDKNPGASSEVKKETFMPEVSQSLACEEEESRSEAQLSERTDRRTDLNLALDLAKSEIKS